MRHPKMTVYLPPRPWGFAEGVDRFAALIEALEPVSTFGRRMGVLTSPNAVETGVGLHWPADKGEIAVFFADQGFDGASNGGYQTLSAERCEAGRRTAGLRFSWGPDGAQSELFFESAKDSTFGMSQTLEAYMSVIEAVAAWEKPTYAWVTDWKYVSQQLGVFQPHRTIAGWLAWVSETVEANALPSAERVVPLAGGTLIATSTDYFLVDNHEAVERANDVEVEMVELGVLPLRVNL